MNNLFIYIVTYISLFLTCFFLLTYFENRHRLKNPPAKKLYTVTIAVPVYNGAKYLRKTVDSLLTLDYPREKLDIIIVDDGSTDDTLRIAKSYEKKGVRVLTQKNAGKGDALNNALKHAKGELFGCLDVDSFVEPNALKEMIGYFDNPKVMAVTPSLKVYHPKTILQRVQAIEFLMGVYLRKAFAFLGSIHVTPGPFTIYRKKFFDKYGGYDNHNLTEDIEIALRIQSHHYLIENAINASVYTMGVSNFKALLRQRLRWYKGFIDNVLNYSHLFSKKYGNLGLFILPSSFLSVLLAVIVVTWGTIRFIGHSFQAFQDLRAINFDLLSLLQKPQLFYISIDPLFILSIIAIALAITTVLIAKKLSQEKQKLKISYIYFMFTYLLLFSFWWIIAMYYRITGKKIRWGGRDL